MSSQSDSVASGAEVPHNSTDLLPPTYIETFRKNQFPTVLLAVFVSPDPIEAANTPKSGLRTCGRCVTALVTMYWYCEVVAASPFSSSARIDQNTVPAPVAGRVPVQAPEPSPESGTRTSDWYAELLPSAKSVDGATSDGHGPWRITAQTRAAPAHVVVIAGVAVEANVRDVDGESPSIFVFVGGRGAASAVAADSAIAPPRAKMRDGQAGFMVRIMVLVIR